MKRIVKSFRDKTNTPLSQSTSSKKIVAVNTVATPSESVKNSPTQELSARGDPFDDNNKDRERFSLESVLDRYGCLHNMRGYLFAYSFILFATQLFINFWKTSLEIVQYDNATRSESRGSPQCCCSRTERLDKLSEGLNEMYLDTTLADTWYSVAFLISAILCSVLERFGRRRMVLVSLPLSILSLVLLSFLRDEHTIHAFIFIATMSYAMTYLTATVNIIEALPRSLRMIGAAAVHMARTHPTVLTCIYALYPSISTTIAVAVIAVMNVIAVPVTWIYGRDSLCHVVCNDRIVEADRRVWKEEMRLLKRSRPSVDLDNLEEADEAYVKKTVQMITDDLAYAEDDSYTFREFLKRLFRMKPIYRLIFDFFAIMLVGVMDGLCQVYLKEMDMSGHAIVGHKIIAKVGSAAGLVVIRNWSRLRAAKTMMALMVITLAARGSIVQYDANYCTNYVIWSEVQIATGILTIMLYLLNDVAIYAVLMNVIEQCPSRLRMPVMSFYMILMETIKGEVKKLSRSQRDTYRIGIASSLICILLVVGIVFRKVLDEDSFSVFVNDLVKDRKKGSSSDSMPKDVEQREEPSSLASMRKPPPTDK